MRVLGHPLARKTHRWVIQNPAPECLIVHACIIDGFAPEYFSIEEMWCYCKMGRGRKGLIEQSERKPKVMSESERGMPMTYFHVQNRDVKKLFLPEEAVEFMKNMNPQQLVDFLLPNDDWYVKTSSDNASGSY